MDHQIDVKKSLERNHSNDSFSFFCDNTYVEFFDFFNSAISLTMYPEGVYFM